MSRTRRIGIIGFGLIGNYVYDKAQSSNELEVGFVHDADPDRVKDLPKDLVLERVEDFASRNVDMVCELAHPAVSKRYGAMILEKTDYFLLSVTAMADSDLEQELLETADKAGTRLFIPHGGVVGLDAVIEGKDSWENVSIEMRKNPRNLDFAAVETDAESITDQTVLYEGPTRGVCSMFPRNVNTHATLALGGIGFDRTNSTLIADPQLDEAIVRITAEAPGVVVSIDRSEKITGVSGASTPWSVYRSVASTAAAEPGLNFC